MNLTIILLLIIIISYITGVVVRYKQEKNNKKMQELIDKNVIGSLFGDNVYLSSIVFEDSSLQQTTNLGSVVKEIQEIEQLEDSENVEFLMDDEII